MEVLVIVLLINTLFGAEGILNYNLNVKNHWKIYYKFYNILKKYLP